MSSPKKRLKEKIERLIYLEPYNINIIRLILHKAISELILMIAHEMSIFNDIRTEILNYQKKGEPKETNLKRIY